MATTVWRSTANTGKDAAGAAACACFYANDDETKNDEYDKYENDTQLLVLTPACSLIEFSREEMNYSHAWAAPSTKSRHTGNCIARGLQHVRERIVCALVDSEDDSGKPMVWIMEMKSSEATLGSITVCGMWMYDDVMFAFVSRRKIKTRKKKEETSANEDDTEMVEDTKKREKATVVLIAREGDVRVVRFPTEKTESLTSRSTHQEAKDEEILATVNAIPDGEAGCILAADRAEIGGVDLLCVATRSTTSTHKGSGSSPVTLRLVLLRVTAQGGLVRCDATEITQHRCIGEHRDKERNSASLVRVALSPRFCTLLWSDGRLQVLSVATSSFARNGIVHFEGDGGAVRMLAGLERPDSVSSRPRDDEVDASDEDADADGDSRSKRKSTKATKEGSKEKNVMAKASGARKRRGDRRVVVEGDVGTRFASGLAIAAFGDAHVAVLGTSTTSPSTSLFAIIDCTYGVVVFTCGIDTSSRRDVTRGDVMPKKAYTLSVCTESRRVACCINGDVHIVYVSGINFAGSTLASCIGALNIGPRETGGAWSAPIQRACDDVFGESCGLHMEESGEGEEDEITMMRGTRYGVHGGRGDSGTGLLDAGDDDIYPLFRQTSHNATPSFSGDNMAELEIIRGIRHSLGSKASYASPAVTSFPGRVIRHLATNGPEKILVSVLKAFPAVVHVDSLVVHALATGRRTTALCIALLQHPDCDAQGVRLAASLCAEAASTAATASMDSGSDKSACVDTDALTPAMMHLQGWGIGSKGNPTFNEIEAHEYPLLCLLGWRIEPVVLQAAVRGVDIRHAMTILELIERIMTAEMHKTMRRKKTRGDEDMTRPTDDDDDDRDMKNDDDVDDGYGGRTWEEGSAAPLGELAAWAATILDAKLTEIVRMPEARNILAPLFVALQRHIKYFQRLSPLGGTLEHIARQRPLPPKKGTVSTLYSVELLQLG